MDYKKEFEEACKLLSELYPIMNDYTKERIANIVPGLKESEDEKIRKALMQNLKERFGTKGNMGKGLDMPDVLAWLEKQREQEIKEKPIWKHWKNGIAGNGEGKQIYLIKSGDSYTLSSCLGYECDYIELSDLDELTLLEKQGKNYADKVEPKFHEGEWINGYYTNYKVLSVNNGGYVVEDTDGNKINILFENEKFHHLFTIADAKDGDVLATSAGAFIYNGNNGGGSCPGSYCGIDTLGGFKTGVKHHWTGKPVYPATKEQRNLLFQKMKEAGYEWDAEKKELKKVHVIDEGKAEMDYCFTKMLNGEKVSSAWSENDEKQAR